MENNTTPSRPDASAINRIPEHEYEFMPGEVIVGLKSKCARSRPAELFPELGIAEIEDLYEPLVAIFDQSYRFDPSYEVSNRRQLENTAKTRHDKLRENVRKDKLDRLKRKARTVYVVKLADKSKESVLEAIELLKKNPLVAYAEPNYISYPAAIPNDPEFSRLWGMSKIQAPQAWDLATGSHSVRIGVLDSGFMHDHPDLEANMDVELGFNAQTESTFGMPDYDINDYHGHGTHVAGIIGAVGNNSIGVTGVNWDVTMIPIRISQSNDNENSSTEIMTRAVVFADELGLRIINMSYGIGYDVEFIDAVGDYDGLFIISAGNSDLNRDNNAAFTSLLSLGNVIFVSSTNQSDSKNDNSCYGVATVDIAAPGYYTLSTRPIPYQNNTSGYGYGALQGATSMAAPHVAGTAALLLSVNPGLTTPELKAALLDTVDIVPALSAYVSTGGRLNTCRALLAALPSISVTDLAYDGVFAYETINISAKGVFKDRELHIEVSKHTASIPVPEIVSDYVDVGASGTGAYEPSSPVDAFAAGEHIEISLYEDSSLQRLLAQKVVAPVEIAFD